jgi:hypothetical protein
MAVMTSTPVRGGEKTQCQVAGGLTKSLPNVPRVVQYTAMMLARWIDRRMIVTDAGFPMETVVAIRVGLGRGFCSRK